MTTTNDHANRALRVAFNRGRFETAAPDKSPGEAWLREQLEVGRLRGTAADTLELALAPAWPGSADGGAGANGPTAVLSETAQMNALIRELNPRRS